MLGLVALAAPAVLTCVLGLPSLLGRPLREATTAWACQAATVVGLLASLTILALMLLAGRHHEAVPLGEWVSMNIPFAPPATRN